MSVLDSALELAKQGVRSFRVLPNAKTPAVARFSELASSDPDKIRQFFEGTDYNGGIACGKVSEDLYLVGLDVDVKNGVNGFKVLEELDIIHGLFFPETWCQQTPTGGFHFLFWSPVPIRQGVGVLGPGVDLRGDGGYLVAPGSKIDGKEYKEVINGRIAQAPAWFIERYKRAPAPVIQLRQEQAPPVQDQIQALKRAIEYLNALAPVAQGERNNAGFKAVCKLKDFGLDMSQIPDVLNKFWKCEPPLEGQEIALLVGSAFKTGKNKPGIDAPENIFDVEPVEPATGEDYIDELNKKYFLVMSNGVVRICCEQADVNGQVTLEYARVEAWHQKMLPEVAIVRVGDKIKKVQKSEEWMRSKKRREYKKVIFYPAKHKDPGFYNLWRGFAVKPKDPNKVYSAEAILGFERFIEHCRENVCDNDPVGFEYLMNWVADMFQNPLKKPPVAIVIQGQKGTGKNVFADSLMRMIGAHACAVDDRNTITAVFNSILEDKLLLVLDETFWSGDKVMENRLKTFISSKNRKIEHKGERAYIAPVYDRAIILGNDTHIVNATSDERRFAVYEINPRRRGDVKYFTSILDGLEAGGDELLMSYFLERDLSNFEVKIAPQTEALIEQKRESLETFNLWWYDCLSAGQIVGNLTGDTTWPTHVKIAELHEIICRRLKEEGKNKYLPSKFKVSSALLRIWPTAEKTLARIRGELSRSIKLGELHEAREYWNNATGIPGNWETT